MGHDIHHRLQTCIQHLLLILKLGDEVVNVIHGAFGFDAAVGLVEDGGDFVFGHDQVASGGGML